MKNTHRHTKRQSDSLRALLVNADFKLTKKNSVFRLHGISHPTFPYLNVDIEYVFHSKGLRGDDDDDDYKDDHGAVGDAVGDVVL